MGFIIALLTAIGFGLGIAMLSLGLLLFYRIFIRSDSQSSIVLMGMAFVLVWSGSSLLFNFFFVMGGSL
jgi:hypothetical protein